jgi:hypothetical protein
MHNVQLSWDPSPSQVIGYIVFRSDQLHGPFTPLNSTPITATSFSDQVRGGQNWFYFVTAVDENLVLSQPSNVVTAVVPP